MYFCDSMLSLLLGNVKFLMKYEITNHYPLSGTNQYNSLPLLQDETGKGTPWKIWKNLKLIDVQDPLSAHPHR